MKNHVEQICVNRSHVAVVMVPFPLQGHLNQLLHLSHLISTRNIPVYYIGTATHVLQARSRVQGRNQSTTGNLHFHVIPTPPFENLPPNSNTCDHIPNHLFPMIVATMEHMRVPLLELVKELVKKLTRVVVIFDSLMATAVRDTRRVPNVESYSFESVSAFSLYSMYWEFLGRPSLPPEAEHLEQVPSMEGCFSPEFFDLVVTQLQALNFRSGSILNTSRIIENLYLDLLSKCEIPGVATKRWAIGPFNPVAKPEIRDSSKIRHRCLDWLDEQAPGSVIYVSFGSTSLLSDEQVIELSLGLERSGQKFIWVLRDSDKGDIFEGEARKLSLPQGYEDRVQERGIVVRDWAPQLEILGHSATGGFMSHCGWNSCMESVSMGVPIATWPMHSDQPRNAMLITKVLKVGVEVKDWGHRDEVVSSGTIEKTVRKLMESAEGDTIRKRMVELGDAAKKSVLEEGATSLEMDSFIMHITRINCKM